MTVVIGAVTNIVLDPIFIWIPYGRAGSRSGNGALSGNQRSLGNPLPFWKDTVLRLKKRISEFERCDGSMYRAWVCAVYHAVYREYSGIVL